MREERKREESERSKGFCRVWPPGRLGQMNFEGHRGRDRQGLKGPCQHLHVAERRPLLAKEGALLAQHVLSLALDLHFPPGLPIREKHPQIRIQPTREKKPDSDPTFEKNRIRILPNFNLMTINFYFFL